MNAVDLAERAGITYRQLDFWTKAGYLKPVGGAFQGTGHRRDYPAVEVQVAVRMASLARAGLSPAVAARIARGDSDAAAAILTVLVECSGRLRGHLSELAS